MGGATYRPRRAASTTVFVFFQARTATAQVTLCGNASVVVKETFYAAKSKVNVSGNGVLQLLDSTPDLIAADLIVAGNGIVNVDA